MLYLLGMVRCCPNKGARWPITPGIGHLWAGSGGSSFETNFHIFGNQMKWIQQEIDFCCLKSDGSYLGSVTFSASWEVKKKRRICQFQKWRILLSQKWRISPRISHFFSKLGGQSKETVFASSKRDGFPQTDFPKVTDCRWNPSPLISDFHHFQRWLIVGGIRHLWDRETLQRWLIVGGIRHLWDHETLQRWLIVGGIRHLWDHETLQRWLIAGGIRHLWYHEICHLWCQQIYPWKFVTFRLRRVCREAVATEHCRRFKVYQVEVARF